MFCLHAMQVALWTFHGISTRKACQAGGLVQLLLLRGASDAPHGMWYDSLPYYDGMKAYHTRLSDTPPHITPPPHTPAMNTLPKHLSPVPEHLGMGSGCHV